MPDDGPEQGHQCALPHHVTRQVPAWALDQFVVVVVVIIVTVVMPDTSAYVGRLTSSLSLPQPLPVQCHAYEQVEGPDVRHRHACTRRVAAVAVSVSWDCRRVGPQPVFTRRPDCADAVWQSTLSSGHDRCNSSVQCLGRGRTASAGDREGRVSVVVGCVDGVVLRLNGEFPCGDVPVRLLLLHFCCNGR